MDSFNENKNLAERMFEGEITLDSWTIQFQLLKFHELAVPSDRRLIRKEHRDATKMDAVSPT